MYKVMHTSAITAIIITTLSVFSGVASADTPLQIDDVQHGTKKPISIAECSGEGSTCTNSAGKTVSATITQGMGVTVGALNATMQTSYQECYTVTTGCTSPVLKPGQVYVMYPRGDFVFFHRGNLKGTAFLPTGVFCQLKSDWK
jgi:hypothetical protein